MGGDTGITELSNAGFSQQEYQDFCRFLEDACGIVLGENKHYLVSSRLNRLMGEYQLSNLGELVERLKRDRGPGFRERIIEAMTTNETFWFRDTFPFDILKSRVIPDFLESRGRQPLKIWSAACSSGQEPYTISITIDEYAKENPGKLAGDAQIVATDISDRMLEVGRKAHYDQLSVARGLSAERKAAYFSEQGNEWEVKPEIRRRVSFRHLNLLQNFSSLGKFDVIFCRNVLIYFSTDSKRDILARFAQQLNPGGYLFLGASESMANYSDAFEMVRCHPGVVYQLKS